jgi:hypothetical protein
VQNLPVDVSDHEKDVQSLEQDCSNAKEVTSPYIRFMPPQELAPSRGWPSIIAAAHVLGDGPGRNLKSQSCEFGLDSFLTPEPVLSSHLPDEGLKVLGNRPSTNPPVLAIWAPGPIGTPTPSMPPQHRFGFHNKKRIAPTSEPSTGANPELSVRIAQARLRVPALQHQ